MQPWTFYPAFLATLLSVAGLGQIAYREHDAHKPLPLSELAVARKPLLAQFRIILVLCGTLFAITLYWFVVPRISLALLCAVAWSVTYGGELLLAAIPAHKDTLRLHSLCAGAMGLGMLAMAYVFWQSLDGPYQQIELLIAGIMTTMTTLMILDKKRFIAYELSFIFLSHFSILAATLALRA